MFSFHLHCIMRINKHFSESGGWCLQLLSVQCSYKLLQLTETLCVEMDYYKWDAHSTCSHTWDSFITPGGSMTSLVRASITFYVEYRQSDICCFRGVVRWKFLILIFAVLLPFSGVNWPRVLATSVTVTFAIVSWSAVATLVLQIHQRTKFLS